jgi:hypothetical protein
MRTSVSQTNLILGQTVIGSQLRDLRTVVRWLQSREGIDGKRVAAWGDSFAKVNPDDAKFALPLDAANMPAFSEPGAGVLASLAGLYVGLVAFNRGRITHDLLKSPYMYCPHDAIVPGAFVAGGRWVYPKPQRFVGWVDGHNRTGGESVSYTKAVEWALGWLVEK